MIVYARDRGLGEADVVIDACGLVKRHVLSVYAVLAIAYMLLPIAVVFLFSFNEPAGRFNYVWQEFTLDNWLNWDDLPGIRERRSSPRCWSPCSRRSPRRRSAR